MSRLPFEVGLETYLRDGATLRCRLRFGERLGQTSSRLFLDLEASVVPNATVAGAAARSGCAALNTSFADRPCIRVGPAMIRAGRSTRFGAYLDH